MSAVQGEVGLLVVVEDDFRPALAVMAAVTFLTEFTTMDILNLVTADTGLRCVFVLLVQVAGITTDFSVTELQREIGLVMVEFRFLPVARVMTVAALFPLVTFMYVDFLMAAITVARGFTVFLVLQVTGITVSLQVSAF